MNHLHKAFSFRKATALEGDPEQFRQLTRAVRESRQLELVYYTASRDATGRRVVDPYHLTSVEGDWYLVAYCHLREDVRMFVPSRIRSLRQTGERFQRPADFSISEYLDPSFRIMRGSGPAEEVGLHFTPEAAKYVREKKWHPTQQLETREDGSLIMILRVNHLLEVKRWAMSWGPDCEVLEPAYLRSEVAGELLRSVRRYGSA